MKQTVNWELCPKCSGQGTVNKPPHISGDQSTWVSGGSQYMCDVCNGTKIISSLTGNPPNKNWKIQTHLI